MYEALTAFFLEHYPVITIFCIVIGAIVYGIVKWNSRMDAVDNKLDNIDKALTEFKESFGEHVKDDKQGFADMKQALKDHADDADESARRLHERVNQNSDDIKELSGFIKGRVSNNG